MSQQNPNTSFEIELITQSGYSFEFHDNIVTEDGYILSAYRILHEKRNATDVQRPVVLLMHGLLTCAADFLIPGKNRALAFILVENGYDVWLGNPRGKNAARGHTTLNADTDEAYWKYNLHEMAVYDIPVFLDRIEQVTKLRTLSYIGHSQGCAVIFALLSEKPEYVKRFNFIAALSPAVITANLKSLPYVILNVTRHVWLTTCEKLGILEFPPRTLVKWIRALSNRFGGRDGWYFYLVVQFMYILHGRTPEQVVKDDVHLLASLYPQPSSAIVLKHFGQLYRSGIFKQFDYGTQVNLQKYGSETPPLYGFENTTCPVALFSSSGDIVVVPKDVRTFSKMLPNCIAIHDFENPKFNHSDMLVGKYAPEHVFPIILEHLKKYSQIT